MKLNYKIFFLLFALTVFTSCLYAKESLTGLNAKKSESGGMAIGLKLGDPTGLTFRKYLSEKNSVEINAGLSPMRYNYASRFKYYYKDKDYYYNGFTNKNSMVLQVRYLFHQPIDFDGVKGLSFYFGAGMQFRMTPLTYSYSYREYYEPKKNDYKVYYATESHTYLDFGFDAVAGVEIKLPEAPVSLFIDANIYVEGFHKFLWLRPQGTLGGRFYF